jgi:hypothetical protein
MWCAKCGQDVPAVPLKDDLQALQCLRCGSLVPAAAGFVSTSADAQRTRDHRPREVIDRVESNCPIEPPPVIAEDGVWEVGLPVSESEIERIRRRSHAAEGHRPLVPIQSRIARRRSTARSNRSCWLLLGLGLAVFTCGAFLIGYSLLGERDELWDVGAPLVLVGQATFLMGLVLQLDVLWQQSKETDQTLRDLDKRLNTAQLAPSARPSTPVDTSLSRIHSAPQGIAGPHLALRNLKGRLDAFGARLGKHQS